MGKIGRFWAKIKFFSKKVAEKFGGNKNNAYLCTRN